MAMRTDSLYLAAVKTDLKTFIVHVMATAFKDINFMDNDHIDAVAYCLTQAFQGKQRRLLINMPPRQLKSLLVSVTLPAFILGNDPAAQIICISYSEELAKYLSRQFMRIVEMPWFKQLFPEFHLKKFSETECSTTQGGFRFATSIGGSLTGRGADFIIIDDPIKADDVRSEKSLALVNEWFRNTVSSRLDDKAFGVLIIVMQRLHIMDLSGYVLADGTFHVLSLPAIAVRGESIPIGNGRYFNRRQGDALHPERESLEVLDGIRRQMGSYNFMAQYQQSPETPEGGMFKQKWFRPYDGPSIDLRAVKLFLTIDTARSTAETADYTAIAFVAMTRFGYVVVHAERWHLEYEALKDKIVGYLRKYDRDLCLLVEYADVGISLYQHFQKIRHNVFFYPPREGKLVKAAQAVPVFESGRVWILNRDGRNDWVKPFIDEFVMFPYGRHDDWVDSLTQLLVWAERRFNGHGDYFDPEN